jgi:hypothetical protein
MQEMRLKNAKNDDPDPFLITLDRESLASPGAVSKRSVFMMTGVEKSKSRNARQT